MINYRINRIEHDYLISTDAPCTFYEAMLDLTTPEMKQVLTTFSIYEDEIISGGNFHGQTLALALDYMAIAMAETAKTAVLGNVSAITSDTF